MSEHIKVELDFIPVEERLPRFCDIRCLLRCQNGSVASGWLDEEGTWQYLAGEPAQYCDITHWAEIPVIER